VGAVILPFLVFAAGAFGYVHTRPDITIGSKNFTEQIILGHMIALLIEEHTNLTVDRRFSLGGTMICHGALIHGEIDLYAEYTGTGLTAVLGQEPSADPDQVFETVSREYRARFDAEWLDPFGMNNTYAITVRQTDAERHGWDKVSDLESWAAGLHAGFPGEFVERPDGYPGFKKAYRLEFGQVTDIDAGLMYDAIANGAVDVIAAFATDARIAAYNLRLLVDDRFFFPPYHAAPVVRTATLQQHPQIRAALGKIAGALDDRSMRELNGRVDQEKRSPESVAKAFLYSKGLLKETPKEMDDLGEQLSN
jgi:glycine betaine/choline ABC-type transport system substrate-binding protein